MTAGGSPASVSGLPRWLTNLTALGWRSLAIFAFGYVLVGVAVELGTVTATTLVGLLASVTLIPVARSLRRRGLGSGIAAALATLVGVVLVSVTIAIFFIAVAPHVGELIRAVEEGLRDLRDALVGLGVPDVALNAFDRLVESVVEILHVDVVALAGPAISIGTVMILSGFLTFFLLSDGDRGWAAVTRSLEPEQAAALTDGASSGLERVSGYVRRTALLAVVDAVVTFVLLVLLGIPLAGPLTMLVFVTGFVPYLGAIVATAVVALTTLAAAGPLAALVVLVVVVATSVVAGRLLAGTSLGRRVDVHPLLVLVAIPTGAALFGVLGIIGLLPVIVFMLAVGKSIIVALSFQQRAQPVGAVPPWLDRLAQWSWRGLVIAALVWVLIEVTISIPQAVVPLVLAAVLAATLAPLAARLHSMGIGRGVAAAASTVGVGIVVVAIIAVALVWTIGPMREIVETAIDGAEDVDLDQVGDAVESVGAAIVVAAGATLRVLPGLLLTLLLGALITFFLLRDAGRLWRAGVRRADAHQRERLEAVGTRAVDVLGGYMVGTALISLFGAVTSGLIMELLGLPLAVPIGILTFFGGFIPFVGSAVTTGLAVLVAVAVGSPLTVVVMMVWTIVFNIVQGNFVTPLVYGRTLSLHPAIVLLAIPAGGEVAGMLGMFLVVPFVAVIAATWRPLLDLLDADALAGGASPAAT